MLALTSACGSTPSPEGQVATGDSADQDVRGFSSELLTASCVVDRAVHQQGTSTVREGASVALTRQGSQALALLADRDRGTVFAFDLDERRIVDSKVVAGSPEQVLVLKDGRVVVSIADRAHIEVLAHQEGHLTRLCARAVAPGPFGLAVSSDGQHVVVSSTSGAATLFDAAEFTTAAIFPLARSPRGVLTEGDTAFVTHLSGALVSAFSVSKPNGSVEEISTSQRAVAPAGQPADFALRRGGSQSYSLVAVDVASEDAGSNGRSEAPRRMHGERPPGPSPSPRLPAGPRTSTLVLPMVSVDPGMREGQFQNYYGPPPVAGINKLTPTGVAIDPIARVSLSKKISALDHEALNQTCLLPRAAIGIPGSSRLFVACLGSDEVMELEGARANPMGAVRRRVNVPQGPTGLALAEDRGELVVFSQFEAAVTLVSLTTFSETVVPLELEDVLTPQFKVGRELFHRVNDARITKEGIACASCHPDALDDGVTWQTPEGPRQTIMLAGKVHGGAPFGWTRGQGTLVEYIQGTCNRLGGTGLDLDEVQAVAHFLETLPPPPANASTDVAEAGRRVFEDRGCGSCHTGGVGSDGASYRFGNDHLAAQYEPARDTPSLKRVAQSGPYFHDGRYRTLEALLADERSGMGQTRDLSTRDRELLLAYLRSL